MRSANKYILLSTILLQAIIILMFNLSILTSNSLEVLKRNVPLFNIAIISITILVLISLKKIGEYEAKQTELNLLKGNMESVEALITMLRTERHDYISHIQSIEALLYIEEYEELSEYVKGISKEYRITSQIVRVGHPAVTAILNSKREIAQEKGIDFIIECKHKIGTVELSSWELNSLISNLVENAIESAALEPERKMINLKIDRQDNDYMITIENSGQLDESLFESLYEPGISTKGSPARGYGLYICKNILDKYQGSIETKNTKNQTVVFTITFPVGGTVNDTEAIS